MVKKQFIGSRGTASSLPICSDEAKWSVVAKNSNNHLKKVIVVNGYPASFHRRLRAKDWERSPATAVPTTKPRCFHTPSNGIQNPPYPTPLSPIIHGHKEVFWLQLEWIKNPFFIKTKSHSSKNFNSFLIYAIMSHLHFHTYGHAFRSCFIRGEWRVGVDISFLFSSIFMFR